MAVAEHDSWAGCQYGRASVLQASWGSLAPPQEHLLVATLGRRVYLKSALQAGCLRKEDSSGPWHAKEKGELSAD